MAVERAKRSENRRPLQLEPLEERIAPAGNIVCVVSGGNLTITGDEEGNGFWIDDAGLGPNQLRINPDLGTTANGGTADVVLSGITGGVTMKLGDGDDSVVFNASIAKNLFIDTGAGTNSVAAGVSTAIGGSLIVKNSAASNSDTLTFGDIDVARNMVIQSNGGYQTVSMAGQVGGNFSVKIREDPKSTLTFTGADIAGRLNVSIRNAHDWLGGGGSSLSINGSQVGGVNVKVGKGDYDFSFVDSQTVQGRGGIRLSYGLGDITTFIDNSTIYGPVSVKTGSRSWIGGMIGMMDDTAFTLQNNSTIWGSLKIANSSSDDVVTFDDFALVTKGMSINNAGGDSTVSISHSALGYHPVTQRTAPVRISNMGSGWGSPDDVTSITIEESGFGSLALSLRSQESHVLVDRGDILGNLSVNAQGGDDDITIRNYEAGRIAIKTAAGNDQVWLDNVQPVRGLVINAGAGDDRVYVDTGMQSLTSDYEGPVRIAMGAGDDYLRMGNDLSIGNDGQYDKVVVLNGGSGTDEVDYLNNGNIFAIEPKVIAFENVS